MDFILPKTIISTYLSGAVLCASFGDDGEPGSEPNEHHLGSF